MSIVRTVSAGVSAVMLLSAPAMAEKAFFANWLAPTHVLTRGMNVDWADSVRAASNGEIDFEVFVAGALLPALATMQGIKDGVAQAGHVAALYHPSESPIWSATWATPRPILMHCPSPISTSA